MNSISRFILLVSFGLSPLASALTVDDALSTASVNSSELKEIRLRSESAAAGESKARAGYLPRVDVTARHLFDERFEELDIHFGGQNFSMPAIQPYTVLGVNVVYDVFSGFETRHQLSAARARHEASDHIAKRAEEKLRTRVRSLFYHALGSQILVDVATQNIKNLESHAGDVQSRIRSGVSTRYDLLRVEVQLEEARTEKIAAENNVANTRARLFEALAIPDDGKALEGTLPTSFGTIKVDSLQIQNVAREDRAAATLEIEESQSVAKAANSHWMPRVSLFGNQEWYNNVNHSVFESESTFKPAYSLGVQMKWNLFDGGADVASHRQAVLAEKIAQEKLTRFDLSLPADFEESKRRFNYDVVNYNAKLGSVRKAEEAVRLARSGVRAGTRTNTEALDAALDLNRAKAATVKAQIDAIDALGELELVVGRSIADSVK